MFNCNFCNKKISQYVVVNSHKLLECKNCGLLTVHTTSNERSMYIKKQYGLQYKQGYENNLLKYQKRFDTHISLIEKYLSRGKLLDIGCGIGYFLKYLTITKKKWSLYGIEPNMYLRKLAQKSIKSATIKDGTLNKISYINDFFDVAVCLDVLEHSVDLRENILEIKRVIKPGGLFLVQAPNYKSFMAYITGKKWDWWCIPDHVLHFSYYFLTNYLRSNGFRILKSYTYEDTKDFISNIRAVFMKNILLKIVFILLVPIFLSIEIIGKITNRGGLTVILAQKI